MQIPSVQTWAAKKAVNYISGSIDGKVEIGKVYFVFFNRIIVNGIIITSTDTSPALDSLKRIYGQTDTLLKCQTLSIAFSPSKILKQSHEIGQIELRNGAFNLQNETDSTSNLSRIFKLDEPKQPNTNTNSNLSFTVNDLILKDFRFTLNNPAKYEDKGTGIINFAMLDVRDIDIEAENVKFRDKILYADVKNISGIDKSGFALTELSGNVSVGKGLAMIKSLHAKDLYSEINAEYYSMAYKTAKDFADFTKLIILEAYFSNTYLNFKTLGMFSPQMKNNLLGLYITGKVRGTIDNLKADALKVTSESAQTYINLDARIAGLPATETTTMIVDINSCLTTSNDIARIVSSLSNSPENTFIKNITPFVQYKYKGNISGLLTDFAIEGNISSGIGEITVDVRLGNNTNQNFVIDGRIKTHDLDIGRALNNKILGKITLEGDVESVFGNANTGVDVTIKNLKINEIDINSYKYSNIIAAGNYTDKNFDGRIICKDPNLNFIFQGLFSLNTNKDGRYKFFANVPFANLSALNIDKRDSISEIRITASADFITSSEGDIMGNIDISDLGYTNSTGEYDIGDINLKSSQRGSDNFTMDLNSAFAKASFQGTSAFIPFIKKIYNLLIQNHTGNYIDSGIIKESENKRDNYDFNLETFNTKGINEFILPGMYIQPNTGLKVKIDKDNIYGIEFKSGGISYNNNYIKELTTIITGKENSLTGHIHANEMVVAGFKFNNPQILIDGESNILNTNIKLNQDTLETGNTATINSTISFLNGENAKTPNSKPDKGKIKIDLYKSDISLKGEKWMFNNSCIQIGDSSININNLKLYNNTQSLNIDGLVSKREHDSLIFNLKNFNIAVLNMLFDKPFDMKGYFSGNAKISSIQNNPYFYVDINGDSVYVKGTPVGQMKILSKWYQPKKRFNILINSKLNGKSNMNVTGYYKPDSTYLDIAASFDEFSLIYFEPFLDGIISKTSGTLTGDVRLYGKLNELGIEGENCNFNDFGFLLDYTGVPYKLNGPVSLNKNGIVFNNIDISDLLGAHGKINGGIKYNYFKDIFFDTKITFNDLQCLNLNDTDNDVFYGDAFATGAVQITGPIDNIALGIQIAPSSKTAIHIPLSNSLTAGKTDLLTFNKPSVSTINNYLDSLSINKKKEKKSTELSISLQAEMNPNANMFIEINKETGDIIKANGSGLMNLTVNPEKQIFTIFGDYIIQEGSYKFVLAGIASKDFTIQQGGKIGFNGSIANTTLDLTAIYKTKASINALISDTSSVSTRRTVNCLLKITGSISNPTLGFDIEVPDLDPTTQMKLNSALNTEGKIQKQFVALLVSGGFLPDELSGIANNSTIVFSNVSDILSNQINNILQQLGIPLDLGLNYQQSDKGTDIFDVAVSTQLFNNRVVINGNIGNSPYSSVNNSAVIGNIDVEIKLDKNGKLRLNLFSHAPDQYSNYLDNSQRSGAGILYQQEFNKIKDIFKRKSKEQREYEKQKKKDKRGQKKADREARKSKSITE